jgi:hypothetical protein
MPTFLPRDAHGHPIPAVRLKSGGAHAIAAGAASARNTAAFGPDTQLVSVFATGPVFLKFGGATVSAADTDHYYPDGIYYDFALGGGDTPQYTHLAVLRADADCTVYVSEKE